MKNSLKVWKEFTKCGKMKSDLIKKQIIGSEIMDYSIKYETISEGVELCSVSAAGFKTACVSVSMVMPLCEKASEYALLPHLLCSSSEQYPDLTSIEKKLAVLYGATVSGNVTKIGEKQVLNLDISCIDDRFALDGESITEECSKLLFELIFRPRIDNGAFLVSETEREKRILSESLAAETSDKRQYAKNRCEEIMCKDEAYGINSFGRSEWIENATAESVYKAYKEVMESCRMYVTVCGGNSENIKSVLFGYIQKIDRKPQSAETLFVESAEDVEYAKETEQVKQGKLVMGFRMGMKNPEDNYAARRVMVDMFGGSPHSKLFMNVREKMSLCYYCSARMIGQKGVMFVQSGIESANEEKAKNAILQQLEDIRNGEFTADDMEYSVKALEDGFRTVSDSPEALVNWYSLQFVNETRYTPENYIDAFRGVTREQVIQAAKDVTLDTVFMLEGNAEGGAEE